MFREEYTMKKIIASVLAGALALSLVACGGSSAPASSAPASSAPAASSEAAPAAPAGDKEELVLGTGGTTGTYYAVGGVMATVLNDKLTCSNLTVTSTGASKANIFDVDDGVSQLATVQNDVMSYAYTGTDLFADTGVIDSFSVIAGLYDETVQIITCDPSIATVADLKGKTVSVGDAGSGVEFNAKQILAAYDLTFDDIKVVNAGFGDSADGLKDGKIDAAFVVAGAPTTAVVDLATSKAVKLVELDAEHIAKLQSDYAFYTETVIPAGTYTGLDADATTVSVRATLIVSNDVSEDAVYELTKAMFENQAELANGHAKFELLNLEDAVKGMGDVPFHAGAAKYYAEKGINVA